MRKNLRAIQNAPKTPPVTRRATEVPVSDNRERNRYDSTTR